jgi:hypothetical protein
MLIFLYQPSAGTRQYYNLFVMKRTLYVFVWACSALLALPAAAQIPGYVPTDGLVGWWPFNGNVNDESESAFSIEGTSCSTLSRT